MVLIQDQRVGIQLGAFTIPIVERVSGACALFRETDCWRWERRDHRLRRDRFL